MAATIIDGKAVAAEVRGRVAEDVKAYADAHEGRVPGLATVLVGDDPASHVYVSNKRKHTEEVGMRSIHRGLDASTSQEELLALVGELNVDEGVDGILVQLPLPDQIDEELEAAKVYVALARLETQGLVSARDEKERPAGRRGRPRRIYHLTASGLRAMKAGAKLYADPVTAYRGDTEDAEEGVKA
jgi:5,10-methylene-tetrahydrofolate dehydrogenase/methenyl tetrahydrofolate cyclohydrolase